MLTEVLGVLTRQRVEQLPPTADEKQFRLEGALNAWPKITNPNLWVYLVSKISQIKGMEGLTESHISTTLETFKNTRNIGDIPVSQLVLVAFNGTVDLTSDKVLSGVCFNYDWEVDGEKRRDEEEAKESREFNWINKPEFQTLDYWVFEDILNREGMNYLKSKKVFKQGGPLLSEMLWFPANIFDSLEMTTNRMRENFTKKIKPLLEPGEIVKAGFEFNYFHPDKIPSIVKPSA